MRVVRARREVAPCWVRWVAFAKAGEAFSEEQKEMAFTYFGTNWS